LLAHVSIYNLRCLGKGDRTGGKGHDDKVIAYGLYDYYGFVVRVRRYSLVVRTGNDAKYRIVGGCY